MTAASVTRVAYTGQSYRWLRSQFGVQHADTVTLSLAAFDVAGTFTNGVIPSGVSVGKITSGGKYGAYDNTNVDGTETMVGLLLDDVNIGDNTTGDYVVSILRMGIIDESELPTGHGVDANGKTDVGDRFTWV